MSKEIQIEEIRSAMEKALRDRASIGRIVDYMDEDEYEVFEARDCRVCIILEEGWYIVDIQLPNGATLTIEQREDATRFSWPDPDAHA